MQALEFLDFDLVIESNGDGYGARVLNSPAGQASHSFRFPVDDWELETFLVWLAGAHYRTRRVESKEMRAAKQLGARLFQAVFAEEVRACWQRSLDECTRRDVGLRLRLRLTNVPELADLPWEFLYDSSVNQFLALSAKTPIVRYFDLAHSTRPVAVKPPLRVLVMISNPIDWDTLDIDQERAKLKRALARLVERGLVILDFLPEATLDALQHRLRQNTYHLFHFIGHGGFDEDRRDGLLILRDEDGRGRRITSQRLSAILTDHAALRLVILNACEGARGAREDPFTGVAQTLVQRGIPAVIAMQYEVSDHVAIAFSQEFYAALVDEYPVDAAVSEARKKIFGEGNDVAWGIPVIYMRSPDGRLFDFEGRAVVTKPRENMRATQLAITTLSLCVLLLLCVLLTNLTQVQEFVRAFGAPTHAALAALAPTPTSSNTPTLSSTFTQTLTQTFTATPLFTFTPTASPTNPREIATQTASYTSTPTHTPTHTFTHTATATYTSTRRPNTRTPTLTVSPTIVSGIYLTSLRVSPENPLRNQQMQFIATLLNATDAPIPYRVRFQLYDSETRKRYTDTPIQQIILARGISEITAPEGWVYDAPLFGCISFYVQLEYQTDSAQIPFRNVAGEIVARDFVVCSPER